MHHLSICSKCGYGHSSDTCVTDDEVVAWFDSQSEEFLAALPGYEDGLTPRRAWNEFFSSSPATEAAPASSPAPVVAGQGEGTNRELTDDEFASVFKTALRVVELRAVRRVVGVDEFKRLGFSIDLRLAERWVLIHADWLLEQGA